MAGNVTPIRSDGQVSYRLGGGHDLGEDQIAYRLGQQCDARQVFFIGDGGTAQAVGVQAGRAVTGDDVATVRAMMHGINPATGEVLLTPKVAVSEAAKVGGVAAYDAIVTAAVERGVEPSSLFDGVKDKADWSRLERGVKAKGDGYRVAVERLAKLGTAAKVDVARAYPEKAWGRAWAAKDERVSVATLGFDVGLNLPKGASLAMVMDTPERREQKMAIWREAVQATYQQLGDRVAYGATGHHGDGQVAARIEGSGIVGTATIEATSRDGDPHIHAHAMIANMTICEDGKARTIGAGGYDVVLHGAWANERAQLIYRTETARAGLAEWAWNPVTKSYDDVSVSTDAKALGSKRHNAIAQEKTAHDAGERGIDAMAERITRQAKEGDPESLDAIAERFGRELTQAGISLTGTNDLETSQVLDWGRAEWVEYLDEELTEHKAVFTRLQVEAAVQRAIPVTETATIDVVVDAYLADKGVIEANETAIGARTHAGSRYTTEAMLTREKLVYETTAAGIGRGHHTMPTEHAQMALATYEAGEGFTFNEGQRAMFLSWVSSGKQVDLAIGAAGTGKTAAADAARFAWEAQGLRVLGISTAGLAAQNLGESAGVAVSTAAGLVNAIESGQAPDIDVLVWDEMGMASTREQAVILPWAAANRVDVRGMGDPKQLDSVGAGSTFARQCELVGAVEITDIMRQKQPHERAAVAQLREGKTAAAMTAYADAGSIVVASDTDARVQLMAAAWADDVATVSDPHERLRTSVMLSQTNATVAALQSAARQKARDMGWITGADVTYRGPRGTRVYAAGEAVLVKHTIYQKSDDTQPTVFNGQRAIVTAINPKTKAMTLEWDRAGERMSRTVDASYVAMHVAPGYALTVHGAQGQTIRHVHTDPSGGTLNSLYVQNTRGSESTTVYTDLVALDVHGQERHQIMAMAEQDRQQWAAQAIAEQIDRWGWAETETAHDATGTPIPEPVAQPNTPGVTPAAALDEWDQRPHRMTDDQTLAQQFAQTNRMMEELSNPVTDDMVSAAQQQAAQAAKAAEAAHRDYTETKTQFDSLVTGLVADADADMRRAGELDRTLRDGPGLTPGRRKEHKQAQTQRDALDAKWGRRVPDYFNKSQADVFRRAAIPAKLQTGTIQPNQVATKKSEAEAAATTAKNAALHANRIKARHHDQKQAPGLASVTRERDELKREIDHRSSLTPDQAQAEQSQREQAATHQQPHPDVYMSTSRHDDDREAEQSSREL